jgi:hypothetical protein
VNAQLIAGTHFIAGFGRRPLRRILSASHMALAMGRRLTSRSA